MEWVLIAQLFSMRSTTAIDMHSEEACTKAAMAMLVGEPFEPRGRAWCVNKKDGRVIPVSVLKTR